MYKYFISSLLLWMSLLSFGQEDISKYLEPVPEVNGKVLFRQSIPLKKQVSDEQLYSLLEDWAKQNYNHSDEEVSNRILYSSPEAKNIACQGEKMLVFQRAALSLDQAKMIYQLILVVNDGKCEATVRNIRYDYSDNRDLLHAEALITDKVALNKSKDKLNRYYNKFRIHTIDAVNDIFNSIDTYLNGTSQDAIVIGAAERVNEKEQIVSVVSEQVPALPALVIEPEPNIVNEEPAKPIPSLQGYKRIEPDKMPGNIIKLLNDAMLITSGTTGKNNVMTASWGGIGRLWEKPVAFCFINPSRYSIRTMDEGDTYTLSFYTEAYKDAVMYCGTVSGRDTDKIKGSGLTLVETPSGAFTFSEAWMIIECKKILAQPISADAVVDKSLPAEWSKNGYHTMYVGEILNVWIK